MSKININQLSNEIANELSKYKKDVVQKIDVSSERVGKMAVKKLRAIAPKRKKNGGDYRKSWKMTTEKGTGGQTSIRIVHAAAPEYRLAHLLEHGHAKRGGGRVEGIPHIAPVEQEVVKEFIPEVEEAIKGG